jgi:ribosomal protein S18 acetylase RimI-like enzyme
MAVPNSTETKVGTEAGTIIRLATIDDAEAMHAMIVALARDVGESDRVVSSVEDFRQFGFSATPSFQALIGEQAGEPVGLCLFFYSYSSWKGRLGVYVQDLYVSSSQRGTGLGRRLIAETARRAGERGAAYMRLSVNRSNEPAKAFYSRIGLQLADQECIFKAVYEDFDALKNLA